MKNFDLDDYKTLFKDDDFYEPSYHVTIHNKHDYKNLVSGIVCVLSAVILVVSVFLMKNDTVSFKNSMVMVVAIVLAFYICVKGVFTLLFYFKEKQMFNAVYKYNLVYQYNQLFFAFEKIVWFYLFIPFFLVFLPKIVSEFVVLDKQWLVLYIICSSIFALILVFALGATLFRKIKKLQYKIKEIKELLSEKPPLFDKTT